MTIAGLDSIRIQVGDLFGCSGFSDTSGMAFAVSIYRRRTGGDIPAGNSLILPIPDSAWK
ncbi:hypothetical protein [Burkholderia sp. BCC0397]|uniref:hypothetical protein n=1 Tax=Burkholderia sp. BCC0397 TaxID=486876 RepID=UPI00158E4D44|nr:hypothetical protein [Burkholderia sp. BCC0397]